MRTIFSGGPIATLVSDGEPYGLVTQGSLGIEQGRISWVGPEEAWVSMPEWADAVRVDLAGRLLTPALIDCHTHLVHGGDRTDEFERRLSGVSYETIAREGGGILSTVRATRALDVEGLVEAALPRLDRMLADGVGTVEIKSGYGLTIESEIRMLRAARRLGTRRPVRVRTTWLAAHAVPPEFAGDPDRYLREVAIPGLEQAHEEGLVDAVDVFCESIAFDREQARTVFEHAASLGLPVKAHAEQLTDSGAARLVAEVGGLSADHLEYLAPGDVQWLAEAGTVAVLLPGAFHVLRETQAPPVAELRRRQVLMAVATDCNPGTSPLESPLLAAHLASTLFGLTPEEALTGLTRNAARALGMHESVGTLEPGKSADLAIWNVRTPAELVVRLGALPLHERWFEGEKDS